MHCKGLNYTPLRIPQERGVSCMSAKSSQVEMDKAFRDYFSISAVLVEDMFKLQNVREDDESWRRNHIRVMAVLVENYANCFREIALVGLNAGGLDCSKKEQKLLRDESRCDICERIKLSIGIAYSMLQIIPAPDFGDGKWELAKKALRKRGELMHPKSLADLKISDTDWLEMEEGLGWLFSKLGSVIELLVHKHGFRSDN